MRKDKINSFIQIHKTTLFVLQAHTQIYHHCRIFLSLLYLELDHKSSQKTKINKSSHQPSPINSILNPQLQKVFEIITQKKKKTQIRLRIISKNKYIILLHRIIATIQNAHKMYQIKSHFFLFTILLSHTPFSTYSRKPHKTEE